MNHPEAFIYNDGTHRKPIRAITIDDEPWFVAMDVCATIGVQNGRRAVTALDSDDVRQEYVIDSMGRNQLAYLVNESGLYTLLVRSDKPEAKPFRKWVTSEVLPSIRKTGSYSVAPALPADYKSALLALVAQIEATEAAQVALEAAQPKVDGYDEFLSAEGDFDVRAAAQVLCRSGLKTGQTRLFSWLEKNRWIDAAHQPYQTRVDTGHLVRRVRTWETKSGEKRTSVQVRITPKGLDLIRKNIQK
jgi:prophage antirepressor-like protein